MHELQLAVWRMRIPAPCQWINANQRIHWSRRALLTRAWRSAAAAWAHDAKLPRGLTSVAVVAYLRFPDRRRRDPHNYYPTLKAVIDGLVDYGLIPDDNARHLSGPDIRIAAPLEGRGYGPAGEVVLTVQELDAADTSDPVGAP